MNCCKDQPKLHSYEMLSKLNKEDFNAFYDFGKEGIFHIVFESIITVYLLELLATLSRFFLIDPTNLPNPILYVFLPSIMIIPIAIVFTPFFFAALLAAMLIYGFNGSVIMTV